MDWAPWGQCSECGVNGTREAIRSCQPPSGNGIDLCGLSLIGPVKSMGCENVDICPQSLVELDILISSAENSEANTGGLMLEISSGSNYVYLFYNTLPIFVTLQLVLDLVGPYCLGLWGGHLNILDLQG